MRLTKFRYRDSDSLGVVIDEGVVPLPWPDFETLFALDDPRAALAELELDPATAVTPERTLAPVVHRAQVIGTGGNYADHVAEAASAAVVVAEPVFSPYLWGAIIGPDDVIEVPFPDTRTDYEVEMAVVIGRTARRLTPENAMDYVFGYTVVNDVSAREVMEREKLQVMLCKSPDTFMPIGPYVVTADEVGNPHDLEIASYLNGEVRQKSRTSSMLHNVPDLLTRITRHCTLHAGDVVTTGTPGGVGYFRNPPEFLQHGDTIVAEVERIGRLSNAVVASWTT